MNSASVFAISKLGLSLAVSLTNKDYKMTGAGLNQNLIQAANESINPYLKWR